MSGTTTNRLTPKQAETLSAADLSGLDDTDLRHLVGPLEAASAAAERPKVAAWLKTMCCFVAAEALNRQCDWNATLAALADGHLLAPEPYQEEDGEPYRQSCWCDWWGQYHELPELAEAEGLAHLQEHGVDDLREGE